MKSSLLSIRILFSAITAFGVSASAPASVEYRVVQIYHIGGETGVAGVYQHVTLDSDGRRLYVTHAGLVNVLDADNGKVVGNVTGLVGAADVAIASELGKGFVADQFDGEGAVTVFDVHSLKTIARFNANHPMLISYDPKTNHIFPLSKITTVLDAANGAVVQAIDLGGWPKAAISNGDGLMYVLLGAKVGDKGIAVLNMKTLKIEKLFPLEECTSPSTLAYDGETRRLFVGCSGGVSVFDANSGDQVGESWVCQGAMGAVFDPSSKLLFESCGEGVISVIREVKPSYYMLIDTIKTQYYAMYMAFDAKTKRLFLPVADFEPFPNPNAEEGGYKSHVKAGTFKVLVVAPK